MKIHKSNKLKQRRNSEMKKRIISILLVIFTFISCVPLYAIGADDVININSISDYLDFAEKSKADSYTVGKTVNLNCDLDFTEKEFVPVTLFGGTFNGNNHKITGIFVEKSNSEYGLFRKILGGGIVRDLYTEVDIESGTIGENIGAVCGENSGIISNVNVRTYLRCIKNVGGIAGVNYGTIKDCGVTGTVIGEHKVGGIVGSNFGTVENCISRCMINPEYINVTTKEISIISYLPDELAKLLLPEEIVGVTDIGGIAGFSDGYILCCTNQGDVGYKKTGANIGGIVGRGVGCIILCENTGNVNGKVDVGGIAGELIPKAHWEYGENKLNLISKNLDSLRDDISSLLDKTDSFSGNVRNDLKEVTSQLGIVEENLNSFLLSGEDWVDSSVARINNLSDRIQKSLGTLSAASYDMEHVSKYTSRGLDEASKASDSLRDAIYYYNGNKDSLLELVSNFENLFVSLSNLTEKYVQIYENLQKAFEDVNDIGQISGKTYTMITELAKMLSQMYKYVDSLYDFIMNNRSMISLMFGTLVQSLAEQLRQVNEKIADIVGIAGDSVSLQLSSIIEINSAVSGMIPVLQSIANEIEIASAGSEYFSEFFDHISKACADFSYAFSYLESAMNELGSCLSDLSEGTLIHFDYVSSYVSYSQKKFFDSLGVLNEKINDLSRDAKTDDITYQISGISESFFDLCDNVISILNDLSDIKNRQIFENADISFREKVDYDTKEEIINEVKGGALDGNSVIYASHNSGVIDGDENVGGVCGIINIDVDDVKGALDLEGILVSGSKYIISAVIEKSSSFSMINANKGYAGGIVGKQIFGYVKDSYSESHITSKGDYVGGICGYSETSIKSSKSRSSISGVNYIGGIAGKVKNLENNISVFDLIEGEEYIGSLAGYSDGTVIDNIYGVYRFGGINGFDYDGKTAFVENADFLESNEISENVRVTFKAPDGDIVTEIKYNTEITDIPDIENDGNFYWVWDDIPSGKVRCDIVISGEYKKPKSTISTKEDPPSVLVEGMFYTDNILQVEDMGGENGKIDKKISVSDYSGNIKVRLRAAKNGKLYIVTENGKEQIAYSSDGSYIVFDAENGSRVYYEPFKLEAGMIVLIVLGGIVVLAGITVLIIVIVKRKKKNSNSGQKETQKSE